MLHVFSLIALLLAFVAVLVFVHNLGTAIACVLLSIKVEKIAFFYGKPIVTFETTLCSVCIGWIPLGGYVTPNQEQLPKRGLFARWSVVLAGPVATFLSAAICIRYDGAVAQFISAYAQIWQGALAPRSEGSRLVARFFETVQTSPISGYGVVAAKCAAMNLLPIPSLAGGHILTELLRNRLNSRMVNGINTVCALGLYAILGCWIIAMVSYFMAAHTR
jgi:membrane-associated protease RseP (regulator of RpoE activity)